MYSVVKSSCEQKTVFTHRVNIITAANNLGISFVVKHQRLRYACILPLFDSHPFPPRLSVRDIYVPAVCGSFYCLNKVLWEFF